jgi:hypothetical protein
MLFANKFKLVPAVAVQPPHQQHTEEEKYVHAGEQQMSRLDTNIQSLLSQKIPESEKYERYLQLLNQFRSVEKQISARPSLKASNDGAGDLIAFLDQHSEKIRWDDKYQLLDNQGSAIQNSNVNLLVEAFSQSKKMPENMPGTEAFLEQLLSLNIDPNLVPFFPKKAHIPPRKVFDYRREDDDDLRLHKIDKKSDKVVKKKQKVKVAESTTSEDAFKVNIWKNKF